MRPCEVQSSPAALGQVVAQTMLHRQEEKRCWLAAGQMMLTGAPDPWAAAPQHQALPWRAGAKWGWGVEALLRRTRLDLPAAGCLIRRTPAGHHAALKAVYPVWCPGQEEGAGHRGCIAVRHNTRLTLVRGLELNLAQYAQQDIGMY